MDQYCVVVCGLQAAASGDASAWQPVAAALKLDHAEFERRVVAALPRIVRGHLDQATAERIAQLLYAMHVDASVLPDDPQLAYIDRAGTISGPLPHSSLGDFIQPGESYRLHGDTAWQPWPEASATLSFEFDDFDDVTSPSASGDESTDAVPIQDTMDEVGDTAPDEMMAGAADEPPQAVPAPPHSDDGDDIGESAPDALPTADDDELLHAVPPPLSAPPTVQEESASAPLDDLETVSPTMEVGESIHDDELIDPPEEASTPSDPDASTTVATEVAAPKRSGAGRILVLLVLVALAIWAYRHWMMDTRMDGSPAPSAVIQSSNPASEKPSTPGPVVPGHNPTPTSAGSASAPPAASAPAAPTSISAAPASAPAQAATAAASADAISARVPAGATTTPPAASPPATATTTKAAATALAQSSGMLPARAGTIMPARSAPTAAPSSTSRR